MTQALIYFIDGIIVSFVLFYAFSIITNNKIDYKSKTFWVCMLINSLHVLVMYVLITGYIRFSINLLMLFFLTKILFKLDLVKTVLASFISFVVLLLSELIYTFIIILVLKVNVNEFAELYSASILSNISIGVILILIINNKQFLQFFRGILQRVQAKENSSIISLCVLIIFLLSILFYYVYNELNVIFGIIITITTVFIVSLLTLLIFREKNDKDKLKMEYGILIDNIKEYEKMLEFYRINNHESKNQLIVIKGMASKNEKIIDYVSSLINDKKEDDKNILLITNKIPTGGLQGLIHQKILSIKSKNINYKLTVSKNLNKLKFSSIDVQTNKHICTIVGTYLDNAIEAVEELAGGNIVIQLYSEEGKLIITISNNYRGIIDLEKIYKKGFSTKGKNRGYGLSLSKDIIDNNSNFESKVEMIGEQFKQILKIKI